ncbi:hypothetical protein KAM622c_38330 [Klebsiella quasipneumoniae subsp. quasipneumoniae]|nr:hypothetical protein KAM622c_38330 [Klebsiella quasipneumoniae subsp. quasipneumoniae]
MNGDDLKPHVESRADGIFWVEPKSDKDTGEITTRENWLCSALEVIGTGIDDSKTRYLILRWHPFGSKGDTVQAIPFADIGERVAVLVFIWLEAFVTTKSGLRATLLHRQVSCANGEVWHIAHATRKTGGAYRPGSENRASTQQHQF